MMKRGYYTAFLVVLLSLALTSTISISSPYSLAFHAKSAMAGSATHREPISLPNLTKHATPTTRKIPKEFTQTTWKLTAMDAAGTIQPIAPQFAITLRFSSKETLFSGKNACNYYGARYTLNGFHIHIQNVWETRMWCSSGMTLEDEYLKALGKVETYELRAKQFILRSQEGKGLLIFAPYPKTT